jgi:FkbM family methyltransferase
VEKFSAEMPLTQALKLAIELRLRQRMRSLFSVDFPGFPHPIWLRSRSSDIPTFHQVFTQQEYRIPGFWKQHDEIMARYQSAVTEGRVPLILDCGANIGLSAIWFARLFPKARIIAIEPESGNFAILKKNTEPYPNIEALRGAIAAVPGRMKVSNPDAAHWTYQVKHDASGDIRAYTIDELAKGEPIYIAKIDIEGAEAELFTSGTEWIDRTDLIVLEFHDWMIPGGETAKTFLSRIMHRKFDMLPSGENMFFFFHGMAEGESAAGESLPSFDAFPEISLSKPAPALIARDE